MSVWQLIIGEIGHRKLNFALCVLAITTAVATLVASQGWLIRDDVETTQLLEAKAAELETSLDEKRQAVAQAGADLEDAIRKQMLGLGFNLLILPEGQDLSELHLTGGLSETMPESYVDKLARSKIVTVNHLLPSVTRRIAWPEQKQEVILVGTRGEVPIMHRGLKKPLLEAVVPGKIVLGHDVARKSDLSIGDEVTLLKGTFTVSKIHDQRGSEDDVTVWVDLSTAQTMLGLENLIHAILALECECAGDRISVIREEIAGVLPGTQVVERYSRAVARAEARTQAKQTAEAALAAEKSSAQQALQRESASRQALTNRRLATTRILVPTVMLASILMIGLLTFLNVHKRRSEMGILQAIGVRQQKILAALMGKAALIGLLGGLLGIAVGVGLTEFTLMTSAESIGITGSEPTTLISHPTIRRTFWLAPLGAIGLACLSSWLPAFAAARQDPALVLQAD